LRWAASGIPFSQESNDGLFNDGIHGLGIFLMQNREKEGYPALHGCGLTEWDNRYYRTLRHIGSDKENHAMDDGGDDMCPAPFYSI
jgi:hypothetical protein